MGPQLPDGLCVRRQNEWRQGATVLTDINKQIGGEAYPNAPTTIHLDVPPNYVGHTFGVYNYYGGWSYNYSGKATSQKLTCPQTYRERFYLGMNAIAIIAK